MQLLVNSVITAALVLLPAASLFLLLRITGFLHFSLAAWILVGGYTAVLLSDAGMPSWLAVCAGSIAASVGAAIAETLLFRSMRARGADALHLMLASLGLFVLTQYGIALLVGEAPVALRGSGHRTAIPLLGGATVTSAQAVLVLVTLSSGVAVLGFLARSRIALSMRAIASDRELATAAGLSPDSIALAVSALAGLLAGLGGALAVLEVAYTPSSGFRVLLAAVVAVFLVDTRGFMGPVLGALLVGVLQNTTAWYLGGAWVDATVFGVLMILLLKRGRAGLTGVEAWIT